MTGTVNRPSGARQKTAPAPRSVLGVLLSLCLLAAWAFALAPSASAQTSYGWAGEIGGAGTGPEEFAQSPSPGRVAAHEASGRLFVADTGNDRIQIFEPLGVDEVGVDPPLAHFEELTGPFTEPVGVAIDQVTADLYVMAGGSNEIVKFNPETPGTAADYSIDLSFESPPQGSGPGHIGSFGGQLVSFDGFPNHGGIVVDNSGGASQGEILIADFTNGLIQRYEATGWDSGDGFLGAFDGDHGDSDAFTNPFDLAVDSAGEIIVADAMGDFTTVRIERFDAQGDHLASLTSWSVDGNAAAITGAILAANPATDEVIVGRNDFDGDTNETEASILQFVDDEFFAEIELPDERDSGQVLGIGIRSELPGRLYPFVSEDVLHGDPTPWLHAYDQADPPACESIEVSNVTTDSATFTGEVNAMDDSGSYRFEYREVGEETWQRIPVPNGALQGGTEPEPVGPHTAEGLEPSTEHEVRLRAFNPAECLEPPTETFTTDPVAPVAETGDAYSISAFRATLGATVNPRNSETTYVFEYGTDQSYGNVTEAKPAGDGREPTAVFAEVEGLDPSTTYHFRVIATNAAFPDQGLTDEGDDATFQTRPAAHSTLPERAYELVSRVDSDGITPWGMKAADSGDAYSYYTLIPVPGAESGGQTYLRMSRDADQGWSADPHMLTPPVDPDQLALGVGSSPLVSADLSLGMFSTLGSYHPMDQNHTGGDTGTDIYLRSTETGDLTWISRDPRLDEGEPQTDPANARTEMYLSPDGELANFRSGRQLLDTHHSGDALYKWHSGELTHVSLDPGGESLGGAVVGSGSYTQNAVSSDGSRVVFDVGPLYVRIDDERTIAVEGGDDPGGGSAGYRGADSETTEIAYTRGDSLYLFDVDQEESTEIASPAQRVFTVSDDADRIYFSSPAALTSDATGGDHYLYLAERTDGSDHEIEFVTKLHPDDFGINPGRPASWNNVDADSAGSILAFTSFAELVPGRRNGGFPQVYVYEAEVDRLYCASCPPDGSIPSGRGDIGAKSSSTGTGPLGPTGAWRLNIFSNERLPAWTNVSESGSVFFQSQAQLLPGVSNHAFDTYEWRGGELGLISSGEGARQQFFADASTDGDTVFFQSGSDMAPHEGVSGEMRIYAARVGGGGFTRPDPEADCVGEECRGEAERLESISRSPTSEPSSVERATPDRALLVRCQRIVRRAQATRTRALALVRIARQSRGARRAVAAKRARAFAQRSRALRVHAQRCRRALG